MTANNGHSDYALFMSKMISNKISGLLKNTLLPKPNGYVIGHRGAAGLAPENTLASFKLAKTMGANWIEFDTKPCGSGEWVVIHDAEFDRITNGSGLVSKTSFESIRTFDAGSWFHPKFATERIPLLSETLALFSDLEIQPNIEVKVPAYCSLSEQDINDFIRAVKEYWPENRPKPLISSFDLSTLITMQKKAPDFLFGYLVDVINDKVITAMREFKFFSLHCYYFGLQTQYLQSIAARETFALLIYTINDPIIAQDLIKQGVAAVFSDFPNLLIPAIESST